jgi:Ca2+-binding EF-hand superfamily protein
MRKSSRKRVKSHASQLLEAYTRRGRDGQGAFHEKVKSKYVTLRDDSGLSQQVAGVNENGQEARTLKDGVQLPLDRSASKPSEQGGDFKTRSPVGQSDNRFNDGDEEIVVIVKEEKQEKVSEAVLARKLNMPFDVLRDACDTFRKYSDYRRGMDLGEAKLDMNNFTTVICELCNVPNPNDLHPDFVDETFRTADRDCSGFIDVEEFCVWHASASFSEEMVLNEKDQQIRNISRNVQIPLIDVERFWTAFRKFDTDGSGNIEYEEFTDLLHVLMKVPKGHVLPKERVQSLWRQADADGSGEINFEEFVMFYIQRFGYDPNKSEFDFASFYKVRR